MVDMLDLLGRVGVIEVRVCGIEVERGDAFEYLTLFTWGGCEGQPLRRKSSPFCFVKVSRYKNTAGVKLQKLKVNWK